MALAVMVGTRVVEDEGCEGKELLVAVGDADICPEDMIIDIVGDMMGSPWYL